MQCDHQPVNQWLLLFFVFYFFCTPANRHIKMPTSYVVALHSPSHWRTPNAKLTLPSIWPLGARVSERGKGAKTKSRKLHFLNLREISIILTYFAIIAVIYLRIANSRSDRSQLQVEGDKYRNSRLISVRSGKP